MGEIPGTAPSSELEKVLEAVYLFYRGDRERIDRWLRAPHPQLGGETPMDMIRTKRLDMLVDLLKIMVNEMEGH
jgi:uncharacterized protein (DUF2384 family)